MREIYFVGIRNQYNRRALKFRTKEKQVQIVVRARLESRNPNRKSSALITGPCYIAAIDILGIS